MHLDHVIDLVGSERERSRRAADRYARLTAAEARRASGRPASRPTVVTRGLRALRARHSD